jgi:hypothetical protein
MVDDTGGPLEAIALPPFARCEHTDIALIIPILGAIAF